MRTGTLPVGPPSTVIHCSSTSGLAMGSSCTESTALRPSSGASWWRKGGSLVASTKAWAAGSREVFLGFPDTGGLLSVTWEQVGGGRS